LKEKSGKSPSGSDDVLVYLGAIPLRPDPGVDSLSKNCFAAISRQFAKTESECEGGQASSQKIE